METITVTDKDMTWIKAEIISLGYEIQFLAGGVNPDPDDTVRVWQEAKHDEGQDYILTDDQIASLANAIELEFPPEPRDESGYDKFLDREDWKQLEQQERRNHEKE